MRVLLGSPVRQDPDILAAFLDGLRGLNPAGAQVDWCFADDNDNPDSSRLLRASRNPYGRVLIGSVSGPGRPRYGRDGATHDWEDPQLPLRVAALKDDMLQLARDKGYDAAFLVDSDLVLRPETLLHLMAAGKQIVAEVFWTRWAPDEPEAPNVWLHDRYSFAPPPFTPEQHLEAITEYRKVLDVPGVYRVGMLGACTYLGPLALGAKDALGNPALRFYPPLDCCSWWGEDRHFCLRAAALGLERWVDTHCPPLHLYRREDLGRLAEWRALGA